MCSPIKQPFYKAKFKKIYVKFDFDQKIGSKFQMPIAIKTKKNEYKSNDMTMTVTLV